MQKILIISYFFPPNNLVGAERPASWFRHFKECGLYPIVITRHWNHKVVHITDASRTDNSPLRIEKNEFGEVHYLPYKGTLRDKWISILGPERFAFFRKILSVTEIFMEFISIHFSAYKFLYRYAEEVVEAQKPDALIVSANPFPLFRIGFLLKKKFGLKWVADYRDDWTTNELNPNKSLVRKWMLPLERNCEKKWVRSASHFLSVTPVYVRRIEQLTGVKGTNIYNGYETENLRIPSNPSDKFVLLYAGTVYEPQDFTILGKGVIKLIEEKVLDADKIEIHFLGSTMNYMMPENVRKLSDILEPAGVKCLMLPHVKGEEFNDAIRNSSMLFFTRYGDLQGIVPAKIFTYMGSWKPVLLLRSDGDTIENLLRPYSLGFIAEHEHDVAQAIKMVKQNPLATLPESDKKYIRQFSRKHLAGVVAGILKDVIRN